MFGDSSQHVFCAVGFFRAWFIEAQKTEFALVFGKTRVAPMRALSIPKLEWQIALLAFRLLGRYKRALSTNVTRTFCGPIAPRCYNDFSPSTFTKISYKPCLRNKGTITADQWFHVNSGDDPAEYRQ